MYKGTTPTFIFTFTNFDPTTAEKVIVSFSNGLEVTEEDLDITSDSISLWLDQAQTLAMPKGNVIVQINFLFPDGQRAATNKQSVSWDSNLYNEVMS